LQRQSRSQAIGERLQIGDTPYLHMFAGALHKIFGRVVLSLLNLFTPEGSGRG
jgi:hypothetical protein